MKKYTNTTPGKYKDKVDFIRRELFLPENRDTLFSFLSDDLQAQFEKLNNRIIKEGRTINNILSSNVFYYKCAVYLFDDYYTHRLYFDKNNGEVYFNTEKIGINKNANK